MVCVNLVEVEPEFDKTDADLICTDGTDCTDDNFDFKNIRFTFTQKCKGLDRDRPLSFSNDEVFAINKIQT